MSVRVIEPHQNWTTPMRKGELALGAGCPLIAGTQPRVAQRNGIAPNGRTFEPAARGLTVHVVSFVPVSTLDRNHGASFGRRKTPMMRREGSAMNTHDGHVCYRPIAEDLNRIERYEAFRNLPG